MCRIVAHQSQTVRIGDPRRRMRYAEWPPCRDAVIRHGVIVDGMETPGPVKTLRDVKASDDTPMTKTYAGVVFLEAAILVVLWLFGRAFS